MGFFEDPPAIAETWQAVAMTRQITIASNGRHVLLRFGQCERCDTIYWAIARQPMLPSRDPLEQLLLEEETNNFPGLIRILLLGGPLAGDRWRQISRQDFDAGRAVIRFVRMGRGYVVEEQHKSMLSIAESMSWQHRREWRVSPQYYLLGFGGSPAASKRDAIYVKKGRDNAAFEFLEMIDAD